MEKLPGNMRGTPYESGVNGDEPAEEGPSVHDSDFVLQHYLVAFHEVDVVAEPDVAAGVDRLIGSKSASAVFTGDARRVLSQFPAGTFHTCVTSPPYWSLRDYGLPGQIGLEGSVYDYIETIVGALQEVRRVLRDDGTLWLNIGDSYTSGNRTWRAPDRKNPVRAMEVRPPTPEGLKPKDLIGVPWRLALALQEAGWYLRADCIWNKPNAQPESVKDRPTRSHEYLFLLSKSERYIYNDDVERGPNDRRLRTVWDINTQANGIPHFATFPPALVRRCLSLTTSEGAWVLDPFIGSGTTGVVALQMGLRVVGVELNPEYVSIASELMRGARGG
jgi:site-specific DNA-methyltransferase (cytosine-N4-specific)